MKRLLTAVLTASLTLGVTAVYAQASDAMSHDSMKKDSMSHDSMSKGAMSHDSMKKGDKMKKDDKMGADHAASGAMAQ